MSMSRPWLLVLLLVLVVFTSHFDWKQQFGEETESNVSTSYKEQYISKGEETVKEKIILSQEKNIQKLNDLVRSLQELLNQCKGEDEVLNVTATPLTETHTEKQQPILEA